MKIKIYEYKKEYENRDAKRLKYEVEIEDAEIIKTVRKIMTKGLGKNFIEGEG